jgi:glutamate-ammonia-ligase adenylyltransferase
VSDFLWEDFLRMQHDNLLPVVRDVDALVGAKSRQQLEHELAARLRNVDGYAGKRASLNAFKDREMFRIDMRHIQGVITGLGQFSAELSDLAEVVVCAAYELCWSELQAHHGQPLLENGKPCSLSVCALGKLGGRELGFASDIELLFVYAGNGKTSGAEMISTPEFYEHFVRSFVETIHAKREGVFEVDLQLRPYGSAGSLAVMLRAFETYFVPDGPAWDYERQALLRLRPIVGDAELGNHLLNLRDEYLHTGLSFDIASMRAMRERQRRHLVTAGTFNAKFSAGGVVDVEYLVQALQINHGHSDESVRHANMREAMQALRAAGVLADKDFEHLRTAYRFFRLLINALRMVRGNARDLTVPPAGSEEFAFLARRLSYQRDVEALAIDLAQHSHNVREVNARLLG